MRIARSVKELWSTLHGVICVHKPRDISLISLKGMLAASICKDANECFPQLHLPLVELPIVEPHPETQALVIVGKRKQIDYSLHPLVVGCAVAREDIRIEELHCLEPSSSGICLFGLNDGCDQLENLRGRAWINEYKVLGQLGRETVDNQIRGKVSRICDYNTVTRYRMQKLLLKLQTQYKRLALELAEVDLESQEAFELLRKGLPRPKILGSPIVYNAELAFLKGASFLLTLCCVAESDAFIRTFIREIGVHLGSTACCRRLLRSRLGPFDDEHALLDKHFSLQNILTNMAVCESILKRDEKSSNRNIVQGTHRIPVKDVLEDKLYEPLEEDEPEEVEDCLRIPWGRNYAS